MKKRVCDAQSVNDRRVLHSSDGEYVSLPSSYLCALRESPPQSILPFPSLPFLCFVVFRGINGGHGGDEVNSVGGDTIEVSVTEPQIYFVQEVRAYETLS